MRGDFRADKCWEFRRWKTTLYGEVLNLTDHDNRIINFIEFLPNGQVVAHTQRALPITPTVGMVFEFWGERDVTDIVGGHVRGVSRLLTSYCPFCPELVNEPYGPIARVDSQVSRTTQKHCEHAKRIEYTQPRSGPTLC